MLSKTNQRKESIRTLLKAIETGDAAAAAVVNPNKYIQHNPQTSEGGEGLADLFKRLSKTSPKVNIVRIFSDGEFIFAHTEYDFSSRRIGFEVFRFEGEQAVLRVILGMYSVSEMWWYGAYWIGSLAG